MLPLAERCVGRARISRVLSENPAECVCVCVRAGLMRDSTREGWVAVSRCTFKCDADILRVGLCE